MNDVIECGEGTLVSPGVLINSAGGGNPAATHDTVCSVLYVTSCEDGEICTAGRISWIVRVADALTVSAMLLASQRYVPIGMRVVTCVLSK